MTMTFETPLLAADSPLSQEDRALVRQLFAKEAELMDALPTDDPQDAKRRARVDFTITEIRDQPACIRKTLAKERAAIRAAAQSVAGKGIRRVLMVGCGDSLGVMQGMRLLFESCLGIPAEPVQALEFAYYQSGPDLSETLVILLSSSGTTTRTVEAMLIAKARGARTLALSNTPGSALMERSDTGLLIHAERKGWPTQASTAAMALLAQFALDWAEAEGRDIGALAAELAALPDMMAQVIEALDAPVRDIAQHEVDCRFVLFAAAGPSLASGVFGAAKVKECTPDHAALVQLEEFHHYNSLKADEPAFVIAPAGPSLMRARDTAFEGKRWRGRIYAVVTGEEAMLDPYAEAVLRLPASSESLSPLLTCLPVQLFGYHLAIAKFDRAAEARGA